MLRTHIHVMLPLDLHDKLSHIVKERNTSIEAMVLLHLTSVVNGYERYAPIGLDTFMPFGKYKGVTLETIIRGDPAYVKYLQTNSETFNMTVEAAIVLEQMLNPPETKLAIGPTPEAAEKPQLKLYGATFIGKNLWGYKDRAQEGMAFKLSRIVRRLSKNKFETQNSIYRVYFVVNGENTIPEEFQKW